MAAVFTCLSFPAASSRELPLEAWLTKTLQGRGWGWGWERLSDGCPIHHGGSCWWAKKPTCGGEGEVVSEESATLWLLQIHHPDKSSTESVCVVTAGRMASSTLGKEQSADQEKEVVKGQSEWFRFRGFGESTLSKRGFWSRTLCCQIERRRQLRRYEPWVYFLFGEERSICTV